MSWWQAMLTILLGNLIVLVPMVLIAHPGTRFGIPFPVLARASFGTRGANVPAVLRGLVACGWFGIQTWIGGQAIHTMLTTAFPAWQRVPGRRLDLRSSSSGSGTCTSSCAGATRSSGWRPGRRRS